MSLKKYFLWKDEPFNHDVIINWNPLKRCMLMLILSCGINALWLIWKVYILLTPSVQPFVNLDLVNFQIKINIFFLLVFLILLYPCYKLQANIMAQKVLPLFCLSLFSINLCRDGYLAGILSPATAIITVSVTTVGLLLFERKLIYMVLFPSIIVLVFMMYMTIQGIYPYAPLFTFSANQIAPFTNKFWAMSMFYFICPVVIVCLALYDLMLFQWQNRENIFKKQSQIDPLTDTFNRRSINQYLIDIKNEIDKENLIYGIILLDLDHFKYINDTHGHLKGDEVLSQVAQQLKENVRPHDIIGRYGGEEFIIILKNTSPSESYYIAQRCQHALMDLNLCAHDAQKIDITASFGIAFLNKETTVQHALHHADLAMYQAKDAGRNTIYISQ